MSNHLTSEVKEENAIEEKNIKEVDTDTDDAETHTNVDTLGEKTTTAIADEAQGGPGAAAEDEIEYPPFKKVVVSATALFLAMFLVALDRSIVATAIPRMTDEFHSFDDIGWYGSAFLLPMATCQLLFGKIYTYYNPKVIFLSMVFVFEVGSALCGAAPSSTSFIVGRAIAGLGSSGIMSGAIIVITRIVPLAKRPSFMACFGAVFGISSVVGPLLGGLFTSDVSWRWCFYINLPIGAVSFIVLLFILEIPPTKKPAVPLTLRQKIANLDLLGTAFFVPAIVCLLLALQWGGGTYAWSNWRVILCFVIFGVLMPIFIGIQIWKGDQATVPPRVIKQRSILAAFMYALLVGSAMMLAVYYTPLWLQAIKGESAVTSGITLIPMLSSLVVGAIANGIFVQKVGYYVPSMIVCSVIMPIGAGLFVTLKETTSRGVFIGFEVIFGFGLGCGMQQAALAAQAVLSPEFVPIGVSLIMFAQSLGGSIFLAIGQNVLDNRLISGISGIPGFDARTIINIGATDIATQIPQQFLPIVLKAYNNALQDVFKVTVAVAAVTIVAALSMEWRSIKGKGKGHA